MKAWFCQTLSNLPQWFREKKVDYPLIHLVEFEWKGKLLRFKTGIQIIKAKAKDHSYLNSSFLQHRQLFHKWKCDPHGKKTIWFQINGHLEDAEVLVWRLNNYFQVWFCDFFFRQFGRNFLPVKKMFAFRDEWFTHKFAREGHQQLVGKLLW